MLQISRPQNTPAGKAQFEQQAAIHLQTNKSPSEQTPALKRKLEPFTGMDSKRDYRKLYRAACDFHEAHNPPAVDREYWRTHTPGVDTPPPVELEYWEKAAREVGEVSVMCGEDPFLIGLLCEVFNELEREYKARRDAAASDRAKAAV